MRLLPAASALLAFALFAATAPARAENPAIGQGQTQSDLDAVQQQLKEAEGRRSVVAAEAETLRQEARQLSEELIRSASAMQALEATMTHAEARISDLTRQQAGITRRLDRRRDAVAHLLAGLQRLELNPPPALAVRPDDATAALRSAIQLGAIVPELQSQSAALAQDLQRLTALRNATAEEQAGLARNFTGLKSARLALELLLARKNQLVDSANAKLKDATARSTELATKAKSIQDFLARLEALKTASPPPPVGTDAGPQAPPAIAVAEWPPGPGPQSGVAFTKLTGRLAWPVQGKLVRGFDADDGFGGRSSGLSLITRPQASVIAPVDATVEYAGPFRSYGQLLILDAGEGYHLLMSGLGRINVRTGETLRAGEPVAVMGTTSADTELNTGLAPSQGPVIYLEIRKHGDAIDPGRWWTASAKEARN